MIALHSFGSVGIGTIMAAILVGSELGVINHHFAIYRDHLYKRNLEGSKSEEEKDVV